MRYSIEPEDRIHVKGYGFLSFAKDIGKTLRDKCSQKLLDNAKKSGATKVATEAIKTASKRVIQKTVETTGNLIINNTADKITKVSKTLKNNLEVVKSEEDIPKEKYVSPKKTTNY